MDTEKTLSALAFCWTLERRDGAGVALTSHDRPLVVNGDLHQPSQGVSPAAVTRSAGLVNEPAEVHGSVGDDGLGTEDLRVGRWRGARTRLTAVSWSDETEFTDLFQGELGEVSLADGEFRAELAGPLAKLSIPACPVTSPECRASLGDRACRVDLRGQSMRAAVVRLDPEGLMLDQPIPDAYRWGRLRYLSGTNCGLSSAIISVDGSVVRLREVAAGDIRPGAQVELVEGCDRRFSTCAERFGNAANFRGEPHLPGNDLLARYPGS
ncbi:DUF2163 domain-containing protein [Sphingomonas arenae]|uniref:DUF2163 domain-containing protein n=1 Tax=Sphingomonas arenae TaxID=2812555 RepID=UPI0019677D6A|nr:DUF2163 domain-containing protein [Sphingomonas arenae]